MYFLYIMLLVSFTISSIIATNQPHIPNFPLNDPQNNLSPHDRAWLQDILGSGNDVNNATDRVTQQQLNLPRPIPKRNISLDDIDDQIIDIVFDLNPQLQKIVSSHKNAAELNDDTLKITAILLMGEPGIGKSLAAQAIAKKLKAGLTFIETSKLATEYKNSEAHNLELFLNEAEATEGTHVVAIDEMHKLTDHTKQKDSKDMDPAVTLQGAMDRNRGKRLIFVATANDIKDIPAPLQTRFRDGKIKCVMPNQEAREKILSFYAGSWWYSEVWPKWAAKLTDGMSIRDLEGIVNTAKRNAADDNRKKINQKDFEDALQAMKDSIALEKESTKEWCKRWGWWAAEKAGNLAWGVGSLAIYAVLQSKLGGSGGGGTGNSNSSSGNN